MYVYREGGYLSMVICLKTGGGATVFAVREIAGVLFQPML